MAQAEWNMSRLVSPTLPIYFFPILIALRPSRFSLVPADQRTRPHPQTSGDHASGEQGAGGIISNVFQGISRFFLGGEDQHHEPDHAHSDAQRTEGNRDSARHGNASERPPGSFPRAVSPTVEEHPDQAVHDLSNRTSGADGSGSMSGGQNATDERPSARPLSSDNPHAPPETPSDNSAARFASSFDQRSGTSGGNIVPASSSTENRGSGTSPTEREVSRSSAPRDGAEHGTDPSAAPALSAIPNTSSTNQPDNQSPYETEPSRHHSPHPVYPTLIPAEHLQRHARREAELREAQERRQRTGDLASDEGVLE